MSHPPPLASRSSSIDRFLPIPPPPTRRDQSLFAATTRRSSLLPALALYFAVVLTMAAVPFDANRAVRSSWPLAPRTVRPPALSAVLASPTTYPALPPPAEPASGPSHRRAPSPAFSPLPPRAVPAPLPARYHHTTARGLTARARPPCLSLSTPPKANSVSLSLVVVGASAFALTIVTIIDGGGGRSRCPHAGCGRRAPAFESTVPGDREAERRDWPAVPLGMDEGGREAQ
mmetsp:Transcript_6082/g.15825  ORF Transcript_6082/g.15825 Transcript_6082/m.15825 type:complete len:231 (+) Transcript_6082:422-1114(+)